MMTPDLIAARHIEGYRLELIFENGKTGTIDFAEYPKRGGIFERLGDFDFFLQFKVNPEQGVLAWGDDLDIAPETLYSEATGDPLPEWMD